MENEWIMADENALSFSFLYERAGKIAVGDYVGGDYAADFSVEINRVTLTVLAPQAPTVLDLVIGGQLTGNQIMIPSGLSGTELDFSIWMNPPVPVVASGATGLTPSRRWQCISGSPSILDAPSQLDLLMWAERLVAFPPGVIPFSGGSLVSPAISEGNIEGALPNPRRKPV